MTENNGSINQAVAAAIREPHIAGPRFLPFFIKALIWGGITFFLGRNFAVHAFWIVLLGVFLFSVPISLCCNYASAIGQIRVASILQKKGKLYWLHSRRTAKALFWILYALVTSFFVLLQFHAYTSLEWCAFFLVIPVFWLVFYIVRRIVSHEFKPFLVVSKSLSWARGVTPFIMLVVYAVLVFQFQETTRYASVLDAVDAQKRSLAGMTGSAVVHEASQYLAIYEGIKAYAFGRFGALDAWPLLAIYALGGFIVFYNACAMLSCFLIPTAEYRRMFGPLTDADAPPPLSNRKIAYISAVLTFLAMFIYTPVFSYLETWVRETPEFTEMRQKAEALVMPKAEQIGEALFTPGTIDKLLAARAAALHDVEVSLAHLEGQVDRAFDGMAANVDDYLDWYYSLAGEYSRVANLLAGEIEAHMQEKLAETLQQGDAFNAVQKAMNDAMSAYETARKKYQEAAEKILAENQVAPTDEDIEIVRRIRLSEALNPLKHEDMIDLKHRMVGAGGAGAAGGLVTAVIVKKVLAKVVGKNVFKLAAKTLVKVAASKAGGTAAGAGIGATVGGIVGSVVPIVGTAAGAAAGGAAGGVIAGVCIDKALIELEEAMNRDAFKAELHSAIREAREEFKSGLAYK